MKHSANLPLLILLVAVTQIQAQPERSDLYCGACHMLVDQISWGISQADPKRTVQVGSYRILPDGSQKLNEIPYKRSGIHLFDLFEIACTSPNDYYQTTDDLSGRKLYKRQHRRDGKPVSMKNVQITKESVRRLQFACEDISHNYEETITALFQKEDDNYLYNVCVEIAEVCLEEQLYDVEPEEAMDDESGTKGADSGDDSGDDSGTEDVTNKSEL